LQTATLVDSAERRAAAFGPFTFDRASRLLSKNGVEVSLPPRVLAVLALLVERRGELVTKQELISAVWRDAFVTETSLAEAISVLRQTLGDDPQRPTYIQTLHRRGYRFVADVPAAVVPSPAAGGALAVESAAAGTTSTVAPAGHREPGLSVLVPWLLALFAVLTAASAVWRYVDRAAPVARSPVRFEAALPPGVTVAPSGGPVAVSNDGALIAVAGCKAADCGIYLRPLSRTTPTLVAGTAGGAAPFFSPDGRSIGYFAHRRLYTIALGGGSPAAIGDAPEPLGAAWLSDGRIVFARTGGEGLFLVGERGGHVESLTVPGAGEGGHRWPAAVPDGSAVVFTVDAARDYAGSVSMRTRTWGRLLDEVTAVRIPLPRYLLAQRGTDLLASTVDPHVLAIAALPVPVAIVDGRAPAPQFAMSGGGTLVIAPPDSGVLQIVLDWSDELRRLVPAPQPPMPR
jgi:DNA-binding winged helix-turn-helix (wHTH) protein